MIIFDSSCKVGHPFLRSDRISAYGVALEPLRNAVKWNPEDREAKRRLQIAEDVVALNPSVRGLSNQERSRRSELILGRAVSDLENCVSTDRNSPELKAAQRQLSTAHQILARRLRQISVSDSVDRNISLSEQLRDARMMLCSLGGAEDEVLDQVLSLLAKQ